MSIVAATSGAQLWATIAAWVTLGVYVAVAIFAYVQIRDARKTRRPYVFVDFDMGDPPMIWVTLQNVGATAAENIRLTSDPPMTSSFDRPGTEHEGILTKEWPFLPPNKQVRSLYDSAIHRLGDNPTLPLQYTVTATYQSASTKEKYSDQFVLDLGSYKSLMYTMGKDMADLVKAVDNLAGKFATTDGLQVVAQSYPDWKRERDEEFEEIRKRSAAGQPVTEPVPIEEPEQVTATDPDRRRQRAKRKSPDTGD